MRIFLLVAMGMGLAEAARAAPGPNVLFIVTDDLRADLGCYGGAAASPNIDALATKGVRFDRAYCQQTLCNPSRSSFLTGRRPDDLRHWSNGNHFRDRNPNVVTLPEWFKNHGYDTRNVGKIFHNWHTKDKGDRRSWSADEFLHYATHGDDAPLASGLLPPNLAQPFVGRDYGSVPMCEKRDVPDEAYYDGRVAAEAVRVLAEIRVKPFFLAVGFWKPHAPFNAPKKYWDMYDAAKISTPEPPNRPVGAPDIAFHDSREILGIPPDAVRLSSDAITQMRHGYLANISYLDAQVGKVLAALDQSGVADRTIVVFFSDHGYHLGEHTLWAKTSNFERDARVPLIVAKPQHNRMGQSSTGLVELVDLFPTLTDLVGLPNPSGLAGVSLTNLLANPAGPGKAAAFTQHPRPAYFDRTPKGVPDAMGYSIRTERVRYTEWRDWETGAVLAAELYDAVGDSNETRNLVAEPTYRNELTQAKSLLLKQFPDRVGRAKE